MVVELALLFSQGEKTGIIVGSVTAVIGLVALAIILYLFIFSKIRYRKIAKELSKRYSYADALLVGQDGQYIHRLEIISRTNLLYVDRYETFSKKFREIYDNDDHYAESMVRQITALINNKQFHNIKSVINNARSAVEILEEKVNSLDKELFEIIKVEEEARGEVLKLKEKYRVVKQSYYVITNDIEMVSSSFQKAFDKLDRYFVDIEGYIDGAEYDDATALFPTIEKVITALNNALNEMPKICALIQTILPNKILALTETYNSVEKEGIPLFHLSFKNNVEKWHQDLKNMKKKAIALNIANMVEECYNMEVEIDEMEKSLGKEKDDRLSFETKMDTIYSSVIDIEKDFVKLCSLLPEIKSIYKVNDEALSSFEELRTNVNKLSSSKRMLDGYLHCSSKQPYSLLLSRLNELEENYDAVSSGMKAFKAYVDGLKFAAQEAYDMVFVYFYRSKQVESRLRGLGIKEIYNQYIIQFQSVYEMLNEINHLLNVKPIDVESITSFVERFKNFANALFDEIDHKFDTQQLAESAVIYANRDRYHQSDVNQQLSQLEESFYQGDFDKVYNDATNIYRRNHIEENGDGR